MRWTLLLLGVLGCGDDDSHRPSLEERKDACEGAGDEYRFVLVLWPGGDEATDEWVCGSTCDPVLVGACPEPEVCVGGPWPEDPSAPEEEWTRTEEGPLRYADVCATPPRS